MSTTLKLADGEEFVSGRSQATAAELIGLAKAAGLPGSAVKTTYNGYVVPSSILTKQDEEQDEKQEQDENPEGSEFDPTKATIDEVKEYLAGADEAEHARVIAAETASAKPRKGVTDLAATPEGAK